MGHITCYEHQTWSKEPLTHALYISCTQIVIQWEISIQKKVWRNNNHLLTHRPHSVLKKHVLGLKFYRGIRKIYEHSSDIKMGYQMRLWIGSFTFKAFNVLILLYNVKSRGKIFQKGGSKNMVTLTRKVIKNNIPYKLYHFQFNVSSERLCNIKHKLNPPLSYLHTNCFHLSNAEQDTGR